MMMMMTIGYNLIAYSIACKTYYTQYTVTIDFQFFFNLYILFIKSIIQSIMISFIDRYSVRFDKTE